ncbi:MAG: hypothetical protein V3U88_02565 [Methylococcales bacterium]
MLDPIKNSVQIQPLAISHWRNLIWWLIVICVVITIHGGSILPGSASSPPAFIPSIQNDIEKEAFIALVFGKVSATDELAISASSLETQLKALKQSGYSSVRAEQVYRWRKTDDNPLPSQPVLLTFEEAHRETIEIADRVLTSVGMTALVFVDVNQLEQANIHLVSWHKLELLAKSGRWEIGISGCPSGNDQAFNSSTQQAQKIIQQRELLEHRLQIPIVTADCSRAWKSNDADGVAAWTQTLKAASMHIGFVTAPFGANYRNDPELNYRRIRVSRTWNQADLLSQLKNHAPRRVSFVDKFESDQSESAWSVDSGEISIKDGKLRIFNKNGEKGALITLSGTEQWQDADVEVQLQGQPEGQFWISLRQGTNKPFVRLGIAEGQVILQELDGIGLYRQLASRETPSGKITLRLRVVGLRAIGFLNEQPLLSRPVTMPEGSHHGTFALAVWNEAIEAESLESDKALVNLVNVSAIPIFTKDIIVAPKPGENVWTQPHQQSEDPSMASSSDSTWINAKSQVRGVGPLESNKASVSLVKVSAAPIFTKGVIVAPTPGENVWTQLHQQSEDLFMISPSYFAWINGKPQVSRVNDKTIEIFARFHHLKILPALFIDEYTPLSDTITLTEQVLTWVMNTSYDGINIVLKKTMAEGEWQTLLSDLNHRMSIVGKTLTVTMLDNKKQPITATDNDQLLLIAADAGLLPAKPTLLYPLAQ